jgi:DNA-binding NtrC family response regulator
MPNDDDSVLELLTRLCEDLAWGRPANEDELYSLTEAAAAGRYTRLAEAFGLMLVRLRARELERGKIMETLEAQLAELEEARAELARRNTFLQKTVSEAWNRPLLGKSEAIVSVIRTALEMAKRPINTMILGPTGSGKEVLAKMIFFNSPRSAGEFVAVNCSAIPDTLFESEMFGIEKGVATGVRERKGLIEDASGGTLFLDEVGDMALENQAKLLRALEEREVMRVGGHRPVPVDLHVISATNQNIWERVKDKRFREDLFYRLNVLELRLPPLSERRGDILLLAQHFLKKHAARLGRGGMELSAEAERLLEAYSWPGNVRELNNEMERAASLSPDSVVLPSGLSDRVRLGARRALEGAQADSARGQRSPGAPRPQAASGPEGRGGRGQLDQGGSAPEDPRGSAPEDPRGSAPEDASARAPEDSRGRAPEDSRGLAGLSGAPEGEGGRAPESGGERAPGPAQRPSRGSLKRSADQVILETLARCGGNKTQAARELGMTREGLRKRLKKLGDDPGARPGAG